MGVGRREILRSATRWRRLCNRAAIVLVILGTLTIGSMSTDDPAEASIFRNDGKWPTNADGYTIVPVCVLSDSDTGYGRNSTTGPSVEYLVGIARQEMSQNWERYSSVRFTGWETCQAGLDPPKEERMGICFNESAANSSQVGDDAVLGVWPSSDCSSHTSWKPFGNPNFDGHVCDTGGGLTFDDYIPDCAQQYATHEVGHALGFVHEWKHPLKPPTCTNDPDEPVLGPGDWSSTFNTSFDYTIPNGGVYDWDSIMVYNDDCADVTGVRFGSTDLSGFDIQGVQEVYSPSTLPVRQNPVGVIPDHTGACPGELITIFQDNEDGTGNNINSTTGWIGAVQQGQNTQLEFCRVDGTQFGRLAAQAGQNNDYAVLRLGTVCPAGSTAVQLKSFDESDGDSGTFYQHPQLNWMAGEYGPNVQDQNNDTILQWCLFEETSGPPGMTDFPFLGYGYGVAACGTGCTDFSGARSAGDYGAVTMDDDNDVIGDAAFVTGPGGSTLPGSTQAAADALFNPGRNHRIELVKVGLETCDLSPWAVSTGDELDAAVECFNAAGAGSIQIDLTDNITYTAEMTPIHNATAGGLIIDGAGHTIDADGNGNVFDVTAGDVTFTNLTLSGGSESGIDIDSSAASDSVTVTDSTITNNAGRGISNWRGSVTIADSTISNNGGGLSNSSGSMTVSSSTISNNANARGGGVSNSNGGTITISNSTISGNTASVDGGGIRQFVNGEVRLWFSTVTDNEAPVGAGIFVDPSQGVTVGASIIAGNAGAGGDVDAHQVTLFVSDGFNVIGDGNATGAFTATQDIAGVASAGLGALANNGGSTLTHLPHLGSPAIDRFNITTGLPAWDQVIDQRGVMRPDTVTPFKDAGSVEVSRCPADDAFEDNDDQASATPVTSGVQVSAIICDGDSDWYAFPASLGEEIDAEALFTHANGDLRMCLITPGGVIPVCGLSMTDDETISYTATESGDWAVAIAGNGGDENTYDLTVTVVPRVLCDGRVVTIDMNTNGGIGIGTGGDDVILGTPGNDTISAGFGDDTVCAGDGNDVVQGGAGLDTILGEGGFDDINGGEGGDTVIGGPGDDDIRGGDGNDVLAGNSGADTIDGGNGEDSVFGGSGDDVITGAGGNDTILGGGSGRDGVDGGLGDDRINGGSDNDFRVEGGDGADTVLGGGGNDPLVFGGDGDDQVAGNGGKDTIHGEAGDDTMFGGPNDDTLFGGAGDDFLGGNDGVDICDGGTEVTADVAAGNCETVINVP